MEANSHPQVRNMETQPDGEGHELQQREGTPQQYVFSPTDHYMNNIKSAAMVSAETDSEEATSPHNLLNEEHTGGSSAQPARGWMSFKLKWWFTGIVAIVQLAIITVCIILDVKSRREDGFSQVSEDVAVQFSKSIFPFSWSNRLLWTTLPSFFMTLYSLSFGGIAESFRDRQPFVELGRSGGVAAKQSVMVDYRTYFKLWAWFFMARNGQWLMTALELLKLATVLAIVPLSAHLVTDEFVPVSSPATATVLTAFSSSSFDIFYDLRPIFQEVAASLIQGGNFLPWTTAEYVFNSLSINASQIPSSLTAVNFTGEVLGRSTELDCSIIDTAFAAGLTVSESRGVELASGTLTFSDRGCNLTTDLNLQLGQNILGWTTSACPTFPNISRILVLAIDLTNGSVSQSALVSCIPTYWQTLGNLSLSSIYGFDQPTSVLFRPQNSSKQALFSGPNLDYEGDLFQNVVFDVAGSDAQSELAALILQYSSTKVSPSAPFSATAIRNSTETVLKAVFAAAAATYMETTNRTDDTSAQLDQVIPLTRSTLATKLFIVEGIAVVIVCVTGLSLIATVSATIYSHRNPSILQEEPNGIVNYAALLEGSNMSRLVRDVIPEKDWRVHRGQIRQQIKVHKVFKKSPWNGTWGVKPAENGAIKIMHFPRKQTHENRSLLPREEERGTGGDT